MRRGGWSTARCRRPSAADATVALLSSPLCLWPPLPLSLRRRHAAACSLRLCADSGGARGTASEHIGEAGRSDHPGRDAPPSRSAGRPGGTVVGNSGRSEVAVVWVESAVASNSSSSIRVRGQTIAVLQLLR
jgi:hypothetical protein